MEVVYTLQSNTLLSKVLTHSAWSISPSKVTPTRYCNERPSQNHQFWTFFVTIRTTCFYSVSLFFRKILSTFCDPSIEMHTWSLIRKNLHYRTKYYLMTQHIYIYMHKFLDYARRNIRCDFARRYSQIARLCS